MPSEKVEPPKTGQPPAENAGSLRRILARAAGARTPDYPVYPSSQSGGVLPMSIWGRFVGERERLGPDFNETERQWRIKWYKDQELHPSEPISVPEIQRALYNPIRRFTRAPLNYVEEKILAPRIGAERAWITRRLIGKGSLFYVFVLYAWYTLKYNHNTWESVNGWRVYKQKSEVYPGDPMYPLENPRPNAEDFYDRGFKKRTVLLDPVK